MAARPEAEVLSIDPARPIPVVSVQIHQAQFGSYVIGLWNRSGRAFRIGMGDTDDQAPGTSAAGRHRIVRTRDQLQQIGGFHISVVIGIQAFEIEPGARWSYDLRISQGDVELAAESEQGAVTQRLATHEYLYRIELV